MELYQIQDLTFTYPNRKEPALRTVNLTIHQGEFITLCGKSGCGKTTLLRLLKPTLSPFGKQSGTLLFQGSPLKELDARQQASHIGFVMQNPDTQIVTDKVWHELAFGLESLGYSTPEIRTRVSEMASFFGIQTWFHKKVTELSGGQKQLLNLASVMVMQPSVLILDEPTSQLDPIAASEFLTTLVKINRELGTTIILSEHRLEDAFPRSDRILVMDNGTILADDTPRTVGKQLCMCHHPMSKALPAPMRICGVIEPQADSPLTVREGRAWLEAFANNHPLSPDVIPKPQFACGEHDPIIVMNDVWFRYEKQLPDVIKGLQLKIYPGELFAIVGGNGTGKTTALSLLSGLFTPYRGELLIHGKPISQIQTLYQQILGVLPQNPQTLFVKNTVRLDLLEILKEQSLSSEEREQRLMQMATLCQIQSLMDTHPYDLSGGEQQRVALAKVLLKNPDILLLDEPTKGMDAHFKATFAEILKTLTQQGVTVVMVSHDIEFCAEHADRVSMFFDGGITATGVPREFFAGKSFYTTSTNRMARTLLPAAVLPEDVILACGSQVPKIIDTDRVLPQEETSSASLPLPSSDTQKLSKRTLTASLLILLLIPLTIFGGMVVLENRKYYFISLLIILETMIPFLMLFEGRKPQARELVVISVLCTLGVAGRAAFFMLPQCKPVIALVIIAGVCFGGETGFLVGAVTGFVSNFFFGQGPFTPWQMFAFGIIGFFAGILFQKKFLQKNRLFLCLFGGLATLFLYGGIMNPAAILLSPVQPTIKMFLSAYLLGLPFDLIHAASTFLFLWFLAEPMIEKLERIKLKYGLIEH